MSPSTQYYELQIKINPKIAEIMSEFCFEALSCEGVILAEEQRDDDIILSTTEGTLKAFITSVDDVESFLNEKRELLKSRGLTDEDLGTWEYSYEPVGNHDWSQKWKEKWDVTHVSDKTVIVPNWLEYEANEDEVVINLDPGCAFGTGTHATTQLCMKAIEKYLKKGDRAADIGMGSGILAICAKKYGASYVYGCDNDETVIDTAIENALQNSVECIFELNTADKLDEKFDFICANILHNVLAAIMGDLKNLMKQGAVMVLSGILDEKKQVVLDAISRHDLELIEETHQNEWVALIVKKVD